MDYIETFVDVRFWLLKALKLLSDKMMQQQQTESGEVTSKGKKEDTKKRSREEDQGEEGGGGGGQKKGKTAKSKEIATLFKLLMLVTLPSQEEMMEAGRNALFVPLDGKMSNGDAEDDDYVSDDGGKKDCAFSNDNRILNFDGQMVDQSHLCVCGLITELALEESAEGIGGASGKKQPLVTQWMAHRKVFSEAWVSCLRFELTPALYRSTCQFIVRHVIDVMTNPLQLSDFLTSSYSQGGLTALVVLEGLFVLIQKHNLEYPKFYPSLYKLLTPQVVSQSVISCIRSPIVA